MGDKEIMLQQCGARRDMVIVSILPTRATFVNIQVSTTTLYILICLCFRYNVNLEALRSFITTLLFLYIAIGLYCRVFFLALAGAQGVTFCPEIAT